MFPESRPSYAEQNPERVRAQYLSGGDHWRAGLDYLAAHPGERVHYSTLDEVSGRRWGSVLGGWKRAQPDRAESTRPFHIAARTDKTCEAWMDELQAGAVSRIPSA